jgi:hypothetical protein
MKIGGPIEARVRVRRADRRGVSPPVKIGGRAPEVPLLSVKPVYGHLLGASSAPHVRRSSGYQRLDRELARLGQYDLAARGDLP